MYVFFLASLSSAAVNNLEMEGLAYVHYHTDWASYVYLLQHGPLRGTIYYMWPERNPGRSRSSANFIPRRPQCRPRKQIGSPGYVVTGEGSPSASEKKKRRDRPARGAAIGARPYMHARFPFPIQPSMHATKRVYATLHLFVPRTRRTT